MQDRTVEATKGIMQDLAFYLWHDPLIKLPLTKQVPEAGVQIPVVFSAEDKKGDFWQYDLSIEPYSMADQSPGQKLQAIMNIVQQVLMPFQQQAAQQGVQIDLPGLLQIIANYSNMPELKDILTFQQPANPQATPEQPQVSQQPAKGPQFTQHTSVRVNRPGATQSGKNGAMIAALLGHGQQPAEAAQIGRPVS